MHAVTIPQMRRILVPLTLAILMVTIGVVAFAATSRQADAAVTHGQLVGEVPRTDLPVVLDGAVRAHAQVGQRIFVAGDFQQVERPDGTVVDQAYIFAYDINTGAFDENFRPVVNNIIRDLEPTPAGDGLYVGGLFTNWDAAFPIRIAKLDALGNLDTTFTASASAKVTGVAARGDKVFIGGDFATVSGQPRNGLAALDATTGAVDPGFVVNVTNSVAGNSIVRMIVLSSDGNTLFALHYGNSVNGVSREAVAKIDVSGPTAVLSGWNIDWEGQAGNRSCRNATRDLAISPDDSFIVVVSQGADNPPNCDAAHRYPTAGETTVAYDWAARMYSSVYSVAISDVAVYLGGHFCAAPKNPIPPGGISSTWPGTANACDINNPDWPWNPSNLDPDNAVFRQQLAALDPTTGQAFAWDPGSNAFGGTFDLTLIDRGLLMGQDRDRYAQIRTGRSGFIDLGGGGDNTPPTMEATDPAPGAIAANLTELAGIANDNQQVADVTVRLKSITTDEWLQPDGTTFGPTIADLPVTITPAGLGSVDWATPVSGLPEGSYEIRGFSTDAFGNTSVPLASPFTVPADVGCTVALDANDDPVITYAGLEDGVVTEIYVRRDGSWLATVAPGSGSYTDTSVTPGDYSYLMRWRPGGVVTDVPCLPDPITVPDDEPVVFTCTVALDPNDDPVLTWDSVPGVTTYNVREATGWIATVTGATTFTDTGAAVGDHSYRVRYNPGGGAIDIPCTPDPITVPPPAGNACTASINVDGHVELTWDTVAGVADYVVRDDFGWVATVQTTSFTDTDPVPGDRSYYIRVRNPGLTDIPCDPTPITVPAAAGPTCTAVVNAAGEVELTWDAVAGVTDYVVRDNSGWIATVSDTGYVHTSPVPGERTYTIRYWNPSRTDLVCDPDPLTV